MRKRSHVDALQNTSFGGNYRKRMTKSSIAPSGNNGVAACREVENLLRSAIEECQASILAVEIVKDRLSSNLYLKESEEYRQVLEFVDLLRKSIEKNGKFLQTAFDLSRDQQKNKQ